MSEWKQIRIRIPAESENAVAKLEDKGKVLSEVAAVFAGSRMSFGAFVANIKNWARAQNYVLNARRKEEEASRILAKAKLESQAFEDEKSSWIDRVYFSAMMAARSKEPVPGIDEWTRTYADRYFNAVADAMFQHMTRDYEGKREMVFSLMENIAVYFSENQGEFSKVPPAEQRILVTMLDAVRAWKDGLDASRIQKHSV